MKVLGSTGKHLLVQMGLEELVSLTGFDYESQFEKAFGVKTDSKYLEKTLASLQKVENFPVGDIYKNAKETLAAYGDLQTKFTSIRNQLTTLLTKMEAATPTKIEK